MVCILTEYTNNLALLSQDLGACVCDLERVDLVVVNTSYINLLVLIDINDVSVITKYATIRSPIDKSTPLIAFYRMVGYSVLSPSGS